MASTQIANVGFEEWSSDGQRFIGRTTHGIGVFDVNGRELAGVDYREGHWTSSASFASFGSSTAGSSKGRVQFFDQNGMHLGEVPADFEAVDFAPNSSVFAGTVPATAEAVIGTKYRVWDGTILSELRQGVPLSWTTDASLLAVLAPLESGGYGPSGTDGTLAVADQIGNTRFHVSGWIHNAYDLATFSPDGSYLAACLRPADNSATSQVRVIDVASHRVLSTAGACGIASWSADNSLLTSDGSASPTLWSATGGATDSGLGRDTFATMSSDGKIASWSDATVRVSASTGTTDIPMSDVVDGVVWSPDASLLAVGSAGSLALFTQ